MNALSYERIREEELKNKIAQDYFAGFDCSKIIGNLDFCVSAPKSPLQRDAFLELESFFWAEAKSGKVDLTKALVQLILTLGKARTFDKHLPPMYLGAFNTQKITFIEYSNVQKLFYQTDFNWNITPSQYDTKEFKQIHNIVKQTFELQSLEFEFAQDDADLKRFIQTQLRTRKAAATKIQIDKNNFVSVYNKWLKTVKPTIGVYWDEAQREGIIDGDFYLADLLSQQNETLKDKLFVLLKKTQYQFDRILKYGAFNFTYADFTDNQKAHTLFWNKYERPPKQEYWDYIVQRRDLLVPQDVRERKGSFFTPQLWVELSQRYLTDVLGEDWQDEYFIWDCAAGTGNLLAGLVNKYRIFASTLDRQDVDVIKDRIKNGANLIEGHVFQFDFLNDDFDKLPKSLRDIINDPEKRKKLVVYMNPPYAEHGNRSTIIAHGEHKASVATQSKTYTHFSKEVGTAAREIFVQFFLRIYKEIPNAKLASFSTLKFVNSQNFLKFRQYFKAEYKKGFICKANTFDNVNGNFPIGFLIWDLSHKQAVVKVETDVILNDDNLTTYWKKEVKSFYSFGSKDFISGWLRQFYDTKNDKIGYLILPGVDMQQQNGVYITSKPTESDIKQHKTTGITKSNLMEMSVYLAIRQCIESTWINNRDQFLHPNDGWQNDFEFQNDCLTYTLFSNNIQSKYGTNHWIPFTEMEVNPREAFESHFMTDFLKGKIKKEATSELFQNENTAKKQPIIFSDEAKAVFESGKKLWQYYHSQADTIVNASLYDIREHFQGRNDAGKMNNKSEDEAYMKYIKQLREQLQVLETKLQPKVYEYGFLKA